MHTVASSLEEFFRSNSASSNLPVFSLRWHENELKEFGKMTEKHSWFHSGRMANAALAALEQALQIIDSTGLTIAAGRSEYPDRTLYSSGPYAAVLNAHSNVITDFFRLHVGTDGYTRGEGFDGRFKLETCAFATWRARIEQFKVVQRSDPGCTLSCRWFEVEGQIYVVQSTEVVDKNGAPSMENTASLFDAWWLVKNHLPQAWQEVSHNKVLNGLVIVRQGHWDMYNNWALWAERVNDFATPCVMNLRCSVVLGQLASLIPVVG